jgi:hypothetical protein
MTDTQKISWNRLAVEATAIVGSILLAFAIDAWWDGRQDLRIEQELLASLIQEFEDTATELNIRWKEADQRRIAATQLAALNDQTIVQADPRTLYRLWIQTYTPSISDPPEGTLTSAIATGRSSLIRSKMLQSRLTGWSGRLANLHNTERNITDFMIIVFIQDISQRALLPFLSADVGPDFRDALLAMPTKNHLNWIVFVTGISMDENEQLQDEVAEILDLLRQEIVPQQSQT